MLRYTLLLALTILLFVFPSEGWSQTPSYVWTNFAGKPGGIGNVNDTGSAARFHTPSRTAVDRQGNVYVSDTDNHTIRKITPAGVVSTLAGEAGVSGHANGTGSAARFYSPGGLAVDAQGNLFVADSGNHTIRKITPAGVVTTYAGRAQEDGQDDTTTSFARFNRPMDVAVNALGDIFVADYHNNAIRKIAASGNVTTWAGSTAKAAGTTNGTGNVARFEGPSGVVLDGNGNLYVADSRNFTIRKITPERVTTTFAGSPAISGSVDGVGINARFANPQDLAIDLSGNIYVTDVDSHTVRKLTPGGEVTTFLGAPGASGSAEGLGQAARFNYPTGICVDGSGDFYLADARNHVVRKITSSGATATLAGRAPSEGSTDGAGEAARCSFPRGVAADRNGNVYVADFENHTIRKITPAGVVATFAGAAGVYGSADGTGSAARFFGPAGLAVDDNGNVYVADFYNHLIRKITPAGVVTTIAGSKFGYGYRNGFPEDARFSRPTAVAVDSAGNVYVADTGNNNIRKVSAGGGWVTTLAGVLRERGMADGADVDAKFDTPIGIAVDSLGNVYVADSGNNRIRKIAANGDTKTLAGGYEAEAIDGLGGDARFFSPAGVAFDSSGNLYVAESGNNMIRKIDATDMVSTLGGRPKVMGSADGAGAAVRFSSPIGITVAPGGVIYVADSNNNRIVKGRAGFPPAAALSPAKDITDTTATLRGTVNPNSLATTAQFEYGLTANYESTVSVTLASATAVVGQEVETTVTGLVAASQYHYRLTATNPDGTASSEAGTFFTTSAVPKIITVPERDLAVGAQAVFTVGGAAPGATFQWLENGVPIRGATSSTLSISSVSAADAGVYVCIVGKIPTAPALLTVKDVGVLIYKIKGSGSFHTGAMTTRGSVNGYLVLDRSNREGAFLWKGKQDKKKIYRTEMRLDLAAHSTGPVPKSTTLIVSKGSEGEAPDQEQNMVWVMGTDAYLDLGGNRMIAPLRLRGTIGYLSLAEETQVETVSVSLVMDQSLTARARSAGDNLDTAVQRVETTVKGEGFIEVD